MARQFKANDSDAWADRFGGGANGAYNPSTSTWSSSHTSATGSSGGTSLTVGSGSGFFDGALVLIHQTKGTGGGNWELNKISSGSSGTSWTMAYTLQNTYAAGAQVVLIKEHTTVTIGSGVTISAPEYNGTSGGIIVIFATNSITVTGTFSANGAGYDGGDGGQGGATHSEGVQGQSATGDGTRVITANGSGGGGGESHPSTDAGGGGGGGGHAASGSAGTNDNQSPVGQGGAAGGTSGSADLTTLTFGGAGGGGGIDDSTSGGVGGDSGGLVFLVAPDITVAGAVSSNGSNGTSFGDSGGGGGGGSGGSILLKGKRLAVGSSLLTVAAGTGAPGNSAFGGIGGNGGNGAVGRIHADYSESFSGSASPAIDTSVDSVFNDPTQQGYGFFM